MDLEKKTMSLFFVVFSHLDENERIQVFSVMSCRSYSPNEIIIDQKDEHEHFYIVEEGEVEVSRALFNRID